MTNRRTIKRARGRCRGEGKFSFLPAKEKKNPNQLQEPLCGLRELKTPRQRSRRDEGATSQSATAPPSTGYWEPRPGDGMAKIPQPRLGCAHTKTTPALVFPFPFSLRSRLHRGCSCCRSLPAQPVYARVCHLCAVAAPRTGSSPPAPIPAPRR